MADYDVVIIGAGIAGASLAAEIAPEMGSEAKVLLAEREAYPGYHATGRSAAFWTESYGGSKIQPLTSASGKWLTKPPSDFSEHDLLTVRGALTIGTVEDKPKLEAFCETFARAGANIFEVGRDVLEDRIQHIRGNYQYGVMEPDCCDIDVAALHQGYLRQAKKAGVTIQTRCELKSAQYKDGLWHLDLGGEAVTTAILVNAAGAWSDNVAEVANASSIKITPHRRTVIQMQVEPAVSNDLPLVLDINEQFYFKPESGRVWLSPHDETAVPAYDAAAEEIDIALAIDRFQKVVDWKVQKVERSWAGLRSFAPDRLPVYGYDTRQPKFFWCAGQGGFGIQTAPAAAKLAKALLLEQQPEKLVVDIDTSIYNPARFAA